MVKAVDTAMRNDFKKEPKDLMVELFTEQNIPFKEITQGNETPELETAIQQQGLKDDEKQKALELFEKKLATETNALIRLKGTIPTLNGDQVGESLRELNKTEEEIIVEYNKLDPIVKLGVEDGKEKLLVRINETKSLLGQRLVMLPNSNDVPKLKEYIEDSNKNFTTAGTNSIYAIVLRLFGKVFADSVALENTDNKRKRIRKELKKYEDKQPVAGVPT